MFLSHLNLLDLNYKVHNLCKSGKVSGETELYILNKYEYQFIF